MRAGIYVFGAASVAAGVINLIWHDFSLGWQPITAFGDRVPGRELLAVVTAVWLVIAGCAIFSRRSGRFGGMALAIVYLVFAIFWLPRFYWVTRMFGFNLGQIVGILSGVGQQVVLVSAGILVWAWYSAESSFDRPLVRSAWCAFGISCVFFGLGHFFNVSGVAALVPKWLPPSGAFWAVVTGAAFVLAGIAILCGVFDLLAARLLGAMLLVFSAFVCLPWIVEQPRGHEAWGGNAYNLAAAAAAWIVAGWIASRQDSVLRR